MRMVDGWAALTKIGGIKSDGLLTRDPATRCMSIFEISKSRYEQGGHALIG